MDTVVSPVNASFHRVEVLQEEVSPRDLPNVNSTDQCYIIEDTHQSECALILIARNIHSSKRLVIKILREYKDTRYDLETVEKRQQCQLEALRRNRLFTPEVYVGLGRIDYFELEQGRFHTSEIIKSPTQVALNYFDLQWGSFSIKEIISNPTKDVLDPDAEYSLVMEELPQYRRLANLLEQENESLLQQPFRLLIERIAYLHNHLAPVMPEEEGLQWGSYEQLQKKLMHNFGLLDLVLTNAEYGRCDINSWWKEALEGLKESLLRIFIESRYDCYFEKRITDRYIRHCHGDLKSPNIWILVPDQRCRDESEQCVKILDAIDFNSAYSNIDILSDFAMLVIDTETRAKSANLGDEMIEYYLKLTDQDNEIARAVLGFYLVEKAIVGAAISIVYDNLPDLGLSLLQVAMRRLERLKKASDKIQSMG